MLGHLPHLLGEISSPRQNAAEEGLLEKIVAAPSWCLPSLLGRKPLRSMVSALLRRARPARHILVDRAGNRLAKHSFEGVERRSKIKGWVPLYG